MELSVSRKNLKALTGARSILLLFFGTPATLTETVRFHTCVEKAWAKLTDVLILSDATITGGQHPDHYTVEAALHLLSRH